MLVGGGVYRDRAVENCPVGTAGPGGAMGSYYGFSEPSIDVRSV